MDFAKSQNYIAAHRGETIENLCRFLHTDTLLFWSEEPTLFAYQKKHWQPILDVLNGVFKLDLKTTIDLAPAENKEAEKMLALILNSLSDKELTGCFILTEEAKSVLLGLLVAKQKISASEAFEAAFLEELYQNQFWGTDVAAFNAQKEIKARFEEIEEYLKQ